MTREERPGAEGAIPPGDAPSPRHAPLPAEKLRQVTDPASLKDMSPGPVPDDELIGQTRAIDAIGFGSAMRKQGFNLYAMGLRGTGRHTAIRSFLTERAGREPAPDDWVYVNNFDAPDKPRALRLPSGTALPFRDAMEELIADLGAAIPALFESEEYKSRRGIVDQEFEEAQESAFSGLNEKARAKSIAIMRTPMGFAFAPMRDGQVIKPDGFDALPPEEKERIQSEIKLLQEELKQILERMPRLEKERRERVRALSKEMAGGTVGTAVREVASMLEGVEPVEDFLTEVSEDLVANVEIFLEAAGAAGQGQPLPPGMTPDRDPRLRRYMVNVMVCGPRVDGPGDGTCEGQEAGARPPGAPVITETSPTFGNLIGRIEHQPQMGALLTDFTLIKPGALHRANGGYLILNARDLLMQPFAWDGLKRSLKAGSITITSLADQVSLFSTISLEPDPIPLDVKIVLIGDRMTYFLLLELDPDFSELFKVGADFEDDFARTAENATRYAQVFASLAEREALRPVSREGLARMIDEAARLAEDSEKLSLQVGTIADILREADYWAGQAGSDRIEARHVAKAVAERRHRGDRIRTRMQEAILREIVLIDSDGEKVGQVNGLAVLQVGGQSFGRPSRITASARMGAGRVIDIEREVELGGPLHSKGVLILSSYLAARYALDVPVSLAANLVFEQSYGGIDGDSASSAELYALLSALSEVPLRQSFAVTGSVNQFGEVQAIGGVNDKIEGFFDICAARGLTGRQAVLIPQANVVHLMLREDVVEACREGRFAVLAVASIDQGMEILTGRPAGRRGADGTFPADSINGLVEARLRGFAATRRRFGGADGGKQGDEQSGRATP